MREYRTTVQMRVLAEIGINAAERLCGEAADVDDGDVDDGFNEALLELAGRVLSVSRLRVFCLGYRCERNFEHIQRLYSRALGKDLKVSTIRKFASDAATRLKKQAKSSPELGRWKAKKR